MPANQDNQSNLLLFPNEMLLHIFSFLNKRDLTFVGEVCTRFYPFSRNPTLQKQAAYPLVDYTKPKNHAALIRSKAHYIIGFNLMKLKNNEIIFNYSQNIFHIWNPHNDSTRVLNLKKNVIYLTLVPDTNEAIVIFQDKTWYRWDLIKNEPVSEMHGNAPNIPMMMTATNKIISADEDFTITILDLKTGKSIKTQQKHTNLVTCMIANEDQVITGSMDDGILCIWDIQNAACLHKLNAHALSIWSVIQLKNNLIASCSADDTICIWNTNTGQCLLKLTANTKGVLAMAKLDDNHIVTGHWDGNVCVWNLETSQCIYKETLADGGIDSLLVPNPATIICSFLSGKVRALSFPLKKTEKILQEQQDVKHLNSVFSN